MKQIFRGHFGLSAGLLGISLALFACNNDPGVAADIENEDMTHDSTTAATPERLLRHVVFFAYRDSVTAEQVADVEGAFAALQDSIPGILAYEHGVNNSPERLNNGLTHAFLLTFGSEADRDAYLPHPAHARFGEKIGPLLKDVLVVDYWTQ